MSAILQVPDVLKSLKPYLTLSSQLDQRNERNIAYYTRLYAVQIGMSINKTLPECKKFLFHLMDIIESTKNELKSDESIQSQIVGQTVVEQYALKIFDKADDEDRQAKFNKNLVKSFYSAGLLFDVLNYFGDLSEDLIAKKQYAKRKAMYLNRCFQTGEQPQPGPLINQDENDEEKIIDEDNGSSKKNTTLSTNPKLANQITKDEEKKFDNEKLESSSLISPDLLVKAQKHCKYASSALQYEDIKTAIDNLEQCLKILKMENK